MSLVGPRPLVKDDDARITGLDRRRLHLTPGMTGHWQILGSARVPLSEMIKLDYLYVAGWSLWSDVKILLRTVPYVLARRGM
jgi:lipopolysaccharide/colanic/teichoic acid biosynthesis glycosyltransferase